MFPCFMHGEYMYYVQKKDNDVFLILTEHGLGFAYPDFLFWTFMPGAIPPSHAELGALPTVIVRGFNFRNFRYGIFYSNTYYVRF